MRRADREIKEFDKMIQVIEKCDVCRLALNDDNYPYILPLNFGMRLEDGKIVLYFHGAAEGKKYELIEKNNKASFEMDCAHRLVTNGTKDNCTCTMEYESVIGQGYVEILSEDEKYDALCILMKHYHKEDCKFDKRVMKNTTVFKLTVESCSGKMRKTGRNT